MLEDSNLNRALREDAVNIHVAPGTVVNSPQTRADFIFSFPKSDVKNFSRDGDDLIIELHDGSFVRLNGFYANFEENVLVFEADTSPAEAAPVSSYLLLGGAVLGGTAVLAGGNTGDDGWTPPTVESYAVDANEGRSLTVAGTANPGSDIKVNIGNKTVSVEAGDDRTWEAVFDDVDFPEDGTYEDISVTVTDPDGTVTNPDTPTIIIDTTPPPLTPTEGTVSVGDMFNAESYDDGVTISGTSEPGSTVTVSIDDYSQTTTTANDGTWSFTIDATVLPTGEYTKDVTITSSDAFGNTTTHTDQVLIDTEIFVTAATDQVTDDSTINFDERAEGVELVGTSEPGAIIQVHVGESEVALQSVQVDADGSWSVAIPTALIPSGQTELAIRAVATDAANNVAETTGTIPVDTLVDRLDMATIQTADGPVDDASPISLAEAQEGVVLTGTVEPGSTVMVALGGMAFEADVSGEFWSLALPLEALEGLDGEVNIAIEATDAALNVKEIIETVAIDTIAPETMAWTGYFRNNSGIEQIRANYTDDTPSLSQLDGTSVVDVDLQANGGLIKDAQSDQIYFNIDGTVPDGTHLVLSASDNAGNISSAYLATDSPAASPVLMSNDIANALTEFNVNTIDLHFDDDATLTITEAQLLALSGTEDSVTVNGGTDDTLTITGAQKTGSNGEGYDLYALGDATVFVHEDVNVVSVI